MPRLNGLFSEDAQEGAQMGLLALMTGISEERWCAGWMKDLEITLWRARSGSSAQPGGQVVSDRQAQLLRLLSEEAEGWWIYDRDHGPLFLPTEEWLARLSRLTEAEGKLTP